jgi:hypothetical protein
VQRGDAQVRLYMRQEAVCGARAACAWTHGSQSRSGNGRLEAILGDARPTKETTSIRPVDDPRSLDQEAQQGLKELSAQATDTLTG